MNFISDTESTGTREYTKTLQLNTRIREYSNGAQVLNNIITAV